jgi:predicted secreted hydrolase
MKELYSNWKTGFWILFLVVVMACTPFRDEEAITANVISVAELSQGFQRAAPGTTLEFPADFGPHPDYQTEWWYYTGNLKTESGRQFGYQLTFFRRALVPPQAKVERSSSWAADQVYMAHFALSDIAAEEHISSERFTRGSAGLAGAAAEPYEVWLEDWRVYEQAPGIYALSASQDEFVLDLILKDEKGPILHGDLGYSQKGIEPGNASYYYSQTRLATSGKITLMDDTFEVAGQSWKDHEYSTSALSPGQVGWDWFSIQLQDGYDLMVFQIRQEDGSIDPFSSGTLIAPDGQTQNLGVEDFQILVTETWRSLNSGAVYPAGWSIFVPRHDLELSVAPYMSDQEMEVSYIYWEGAVAVQGQHKGNPLDGDGYVELTGYAASMEGEF